MVGHRVFPTPIEEDIDLAEKREFGKRQGKVETGQEKLNCLHVWTIVRSFLVLVRTSTHLISCMHDFVTVENPFEKIIVLQ